MRRYALVALALVAVFGCGSEEKREENAKRASAAKEAEVEYVYAGGWGSKGSGEGQFDGPEAIAVGPDGTVYVVDSYYDTRLQYFDRSGTYLGQLEGPAYFEFRRIPNSVAVAPDGTVYVVDGKRRLDSFTAEGEHLGELTLPAGATDETVLADVPKCFGEGSYAWALAAANS